MLNLNDRRLKHPVTYALVCALILILSPVLKDSFLAILRRPLIVFTWIQDEIRAVVFFHRNPEAVLDANGLASRLGRRVEELEPEIEALCAGRILQCAGGLIRYKPSPEMRETIGTFVEACQDRGRRLALIALVLHKINPAASA